MEVINNEEHAWTVTDLEIYLLEKFLVASMVVKIAPFNFRRALNFFKQSTVSCLWIADATRTRCWINEREKRWIREVRRRKEEAYRYPGMLECFCCRDTFVWIHSQHLIDQVLGLRCDCVPLGLWILPNKWKSGIRSINHRACSSKKGKVLHHTFQP